MTRRLISTIIATGLFVFGPGCEQEAAKKSDPKDKPAAPTTSSTSTQTKTDKDEDKDPPDPCAADSAGDETDTETESSTDTGDEEGITLRLQGTNSATATSTASTTSTDTETDTDTDTDSSSGGTSGNPCDSAGNGSGSGTSTEGDGGIAGPGDNNLENFKDFIDPPQKAECHTQGKAFFRDAPVGSGVPGVCHPTAVYSAQLACNRAAIKTFSKSNAVDAKIAEYEAKNMYLDDCGLNPNNKVVVFMVCYKTDEASTTCVKLDQLPATLNSLYITTEVIIQG